MKNILYVEDDAINALVMVKLLQGHYHVQVAYDGEVCLALLHEHPFDLVLMDINLGNGKMDGIEILKKMRSEEAFRHIPVFAVTSYAMPEDEDKFLKEGFDKFFAKPVFKEDLLKGIASVLTDP